MRNYLTLLITILLWVVTPVAVPADPPKDTLVIAISNDFQPFTFLNADGEPTGMLVDLWRLWGKKTGKKIVFIASDWQTSLDNLKSRKADIHSGLIFSPERSGWLSITHPFYQAEVRFFYPLKQGRISDLNQLSGETVAVVKGTQLEQYLRKNYPHLGILVCDSREELVKASRSGRVKGFIALSPVGIALLDRLGVTGEFESLAKSFYSEDLHPGVLKENGAVQAVVDKGLSAISTQEWSAIEARWIQDPAKRHFQPANIIRFTPAEKRWLGNQATIRVGMSPVFPPLKFAENGEIKGIEPDYLRLLSTYTGIQFQYVICDFSSMDARLQAGELDMFISFNIPERLAYMNFTDPMMEFKQVIITRHDVPFLSGIGALKGKKVATVKGVKLYDKILGNHPDIEAVPFETMEEMFKGVSKHRADALISRTIFAGYLINHYPDLKIAGVADLPPEPYRYAVRKDYAELVGILNKAIAAIPIEQHEALVQKWVPVRFDHGPNWDKIRKWTLAAGAVFAVILGLTLYWNRRLTREVARQKLAERALQDSEARLRVIFEASEAGILQISPMGVVEFANRRAAEMFGMTMPEFIGTRYIDHLHESDRHIGLASMTRGVQGEVQSVSSERHYVRADGSEFWGHMSGSRLENMDGSLRALIGVITDITRLRLLSDALREANDHLESLFNHANAPIIVWDPALRITRFNHAFEKLAGRGVADVYNKHISLLFPLADMDRALALINRATAGDKWDVVEIPIQLADGSIRTLLWNSAPIYAADGVTVISTIAQGQDISELRAYITENRHLETMAEIRELIEKEERSRLARDLHDGAGQSLQAILLHLKLMVAGKVEGDVTQALNMLAKEVSETSDELRGIMQQLRPAYLDDHDLDAAVYNRCEMMRQRNVPVMVDCYGDFSGLSFAISDNFYRIFQEALANAVRHAAASQIKVYLNRSKMSLRLIVSDDGTGVGEGSSGDGIGMRIMKERADLIAAKLEIDSSARGTTVSVFMESI